MNPVLTTSLAVLAKKLGWIIRRLRGVPVRRTGSGDQPVREPLCRTDIERELRLPPGDRWSGANDGPGPGA